MSRGPADLSAAFTAGGPWELDPDHLAWRHDIERRRATTVAEVPALIRRRRLPPGGRVLMVAAVVGSALAGWYVHERRQVGTERRLGLSRRLRLAFEHLGPTYIKLGQILSSGEGLFPDEVVHEFARLRDQVPPEPFGVVRRILEEDLGRPVADVFRSIDPSPVAAASIAQVHRATLRSGEPVVVKVQRPTVGRLVRRDLTAMSWLAPLLVGRIPVSALANPPALVELFASTIVEELDFRLEADSMLAVAGVLAETGQQALVVPRPHPELVTRRVLVMEQMEGFAWGEAPAMRAAGIDTAEVLRSALLAFLEGVLLYGVFHGDLHGGNLLVRRDARVALLDFGITGRLSEPRRLAFLRLVMATTANDVNAQVEALRDVGALPPDVDVAAVVHDLGLDQPAVDPLAVSAEELATMIRDLARSLLAYGARMPKELMLFVKDMVFLDGAMALMAPDIDILAEIVRIVVYFHEHHGERIARDMGIDPRAQPIIDLSGIRASVGASETSTLTYRELQQRRELIRHRLEQHDRRQRRRARWRRSDQ